MCHKLKMQLVLFYLDLEFSVIYRYCQLFQIISTYLEGHISIPTFIEYQSDIGILRNMKSLQHRPN